MKKYSIEADLVTWIGTYALTIYGLLHLMNKFLN